MAFFIQKLRELGEDSLIRGRELFARTSREAQAFLAQRKHGAFHDAVLSASVMLALADGKLSAEERKSLLRYLSSSDIFACFPQEKVVSSLDDILRLWERDSDMARISSLQRIGRIRGRTEDARMLVRLSLAVVRADGAPLDAEEKDVLRTICRELDLPVEDMAEEWQSCHNPSPKRKESVMSVNLSKGGNINLSKAAPNLETVILGLGWDVRSSDGAPFDLDASAFLLTESGKVRNEKDFVFFNNLEGDGGAVRHTGDNLTGDGDGDDEQIIINLSAVAPEVVRIPLVVTIYEAEARKQNFGQVTNAFVRVVDKNTDAELARYDLSEDMYMETGMIFGELYRHDGDWKFRAVGQGKAEGLAGFCREFGVQS